jgi:arsenite/tail-anchored protein-transporting ATPase
MTTDIQFFIGKGGVGKSTSSAISALNYAQKSGKTLLVSMDPAHNQRDIFKQNFSEKPKQVQNYLFIKEVDIDAWMAAYLKDAEKQLKTAFSYQTAFNIQNSYKILKYSPGLQEYALLLAFEHNLSCSDEWDFMIFDMPPTAMTIPFFSLPFVTLLWLKELLKLRNQIWKKKEIVSKIKFGRKEFEQDRVKTALVSLIERHELLKNHFSSQRTQINLVLNEDHLSISEAHRIIQKLSELHINVDRIIVNKTVTGTVGEQLRCEFKGYPLIAYPEYTGELYGIPSLEHYLCSNIRELDSVIEA